MLQNLLITDDAITGYLEIERTSAVRLDQEGNPLVVGYTLVEITIDGAGLRRLARDAIANKGRVSRSRTATARAEKREPRGGADRTGEGTE